MVGAITKRALRILLFIGIMFLIVSLSPFVVRPLQGTNLYPLVGSVVFFLTFFLLYITPLSFVNWEGEDSLGPLGLNIDDEKMNIDLSIGLVSGAISAFFVVLMAIVFGGTLRPLSEIGSNLIMGQIIITIPTALLEELCYRGYLLSRMTQLIGRRMAIIGSSAVFSLLHFSWWIPLGSVSMLLVILFTLNIAMGGIVLGVGYFRTGNKLWLPIGFHFSWNMVGYIMFPQFPLVPVEMPYLYQIEWGLTTIPGFLIGLVMVLVLTRKKNR
ncbi:CPBP family intramembrane metalloprotease [Candidatus Thorarchaeota archaeon]|nr:MAG: CPBP family intramembrane metalloprotease [Candidatus Thorarchaeota archaeon]